MLTFCTLFDSNYLDKGLVLHQSLESAINESFKLYVLAMDQKCYQILKCMNLKHTHVISLEEFMDEELT